MQHLDRLLRHRVAAAMIAGAALGLSIGAVVPPAGPGARVTPRRGWSLPGPKAIARVDESEFSRVRGAPIWGAAGSRAVKAASWRLVGIMNQAGPVALVAVTGRPDVLHLAAGDPLPDGAVVRSIESNALRFVRDGCGFERALYSAADTPIDGSCAASKPAVVAKSPDQPSK